MEVLLFLAVGGLAVVFAVLMLSTENAVHSALCLIANFGCVAFIFLMLDAPFLSMVQIAVYAGAIMVLFLFVIMLLKAEQSSDTTTRKFPNLWLLATGLCVILLGVLTLPLITGGFKLPELKSAGSIVRFANASSVAATRFEIEGDTLAESIVSDAVAVGEATSFETLPSGTYEVTILDAGTGEPLMGGEDVVLSDDGAVTIVAKGEYIDTEDAFEPLTLVTLPSDVSEAGGTDARLVVYNDLPQVDGVEQPLNLVDLGPEAAVTTVVRDGQTVLIDPILAASVQRQGDPVVVTVPRGTYNLALLDASFNVVHRLDEFVVKADTETDILYLPAGAGAEGGVVEIFTSDTQPSFGSPKGIGRMLFTDYLLPVNLVGMLLLVALIGVIVLSRPEAEKSERRNNVRRKVSRPLVNVISTQTGSDVGAETPQLPTGDS